MTSEEYSDIIECIKFGCPAKALPLIKSLNDLIRNCTDKITKENVEETNITEGDEK